MKKSSILFLLFISIFCGVSEGYAKPNFRVIKSKRVFGCGEWKPIMHGDTKVGETRECTNIFGKHRTETVHFH